MDKYLIVGGTGVMGHFLSRQLVERGHRPVVLTVSGSTIFVNDILDKLELVTCDITDAAKLDQIVGDFGVTHIAHFGAQLNREAEQDARRAVKVGIEGMVNVMESARNHKVKRVVYASSKGVYGRIEGEYWHPGYKPVPEDYPADPGTYDMYALLKLSAENLGIWYQKKFGVEFVAIRFAATVGPGKLRRHGLFVHHSIMIENAMLGRPTHIPHGADAVHDPLYNGDSAHGVLCALTAPKPRHYAYNIGPGYGVTLQEFANAVKQVHPEAEITIGPGHFYVPKGENPANFILDISRARRELGFEPKYDAVAMIKDYEATMAKLGMKPQGT